MSSEISPSSQGISQLSQSNFLIVPRLIQLEQLEPNGAKNVTFKDPKEIQQQDRRESMEDSQFSKQSFDKKSYRNSPQSSQDNQNSDEKYDHLKKFQTEIKYLESQKKSMIGRNRNVSIEESKKSQFSKLDSFKLTPSFQGPLNKQIVKVRTFGQPDESQIQDKLIQSVEREGPKKDSFIEQINIPLISEKEKKIVHFKSFWSKKVLGLIRALGKLKNPYRIYDDSYRLKYFRKNFFQIISDNSSSFKFLTFQGARTIKQRKINFNRLLIHPDSHLRQSWNIFITVIYFLSIVLIPLQLSIYKEEIQFDFLILTGGKLYQLILGFIQIFDIFINLLTKIQVNGVLCNDSTVIFKKYLNNHFIIDIFILFFSVVAWYYQIDIFSKDQFNLCTLGFVVLLRLVTISHYWSLILDLIDPSDVIQLIIRLVIFIFLSAHICACLWYYIGMQEGNSWMNNANFSIEGLSSQLKYLRCFYWSITWLCSISTNSIVPVTSLETVMGVFQSIMSVAFLALFINDVGKIISVQHDSDKVECREALRYFKLRKLAQPLYKNLKYQLEYSIVKRENKDENTYISQLSQNIQKEIKISLYQKVREIKNDYQCLESSQLIRENCSQRCIEELCSSIILRKTKSGEILINKGDLIDRLYFLVNGKVRSSIVLRERQVTLGDLDSGQIIFEKEFLLNQRSPSNLVCESECTLIYIDNKQFNLVIRRHQEEFERIQMYIDNMKYNQHFQVTRQLCQICNRSNHCLGQCPFTFFIPNKRLLIREHNRVVYNARAKSHYRNVSNRFNTRLNLNLISILGIGFGVREGLLRDSELTNEMMNKLKGSNQNFEDSLFVDPEGGTSRQTLLDKQYTYTYTQKNQPQPDMQILQPQQTSLSSGQSQPTTQLMRKKASMGVSDSQLFSTSSLVNETRLPYPLQKSMFSDRISVPMNSNSRQQEQEPPMIGLRKNNNFDRISSQQQRIPSSKKGTTSTGSVNHERQVRPKLTSISTNIQKQATQNSAHQPILNQSTSILHQGFQKSMTSIPQNSSHTPSPPFIDEEGLLFSDHSNNPLNQAFFACYQKPRFPMDDFDRMHVYTVYFRNYNIDQISRRLNMKSLRFIEQYKSAKKIQQQLQNQVAEQQEQNDQSEELVYPLRGYKKSLTEIPASKEIYK